MKYPAKNYNGRPWRKNFCEVLTRTLGYLHFKTPVRLSAIKATQEFSRGHFEAARGSIADNIAYCTKDMGRVAGPWTHGTYESIGWTYMWLNPMTETITGFYKV